MNNDESPSPRICVIGIGNEFRSDDGIGVIAAKRIRELHPAFCTVLDNSGEGAGLMESWKEADTVYLIDAVSSGSPCGTVFRIDACTQQIPSDIFHCSTHAFGVAESVEMARVLGTLPDSCIFFGIEGSNFDPGCEIAPPVRTAADGVVKAILSEIDSAVSSPASHF